MAQKINMDGMRFGNLTVMGDSETIKGRVYCWCKCDCGTLKPVMGQNLRDGKTVSCGCSRKGPRTRKAILKSDPNVERKRQGVDGPIILDIIYNPDREEVKSIGITFESRVHLARSMRKVFARWSEVAEVCGDDVVAELRGAKA